ncbi:MULTISPECIES: hypothetical protein [Acetobacter]|nr:MULTISPECIES: hypothetical protein [Acetobacter]KAA8423949.1 hypothetical protein FKW54_10750 [Acetobacter pomorum]KAA8438348.1 hypothetical protein FKW50_00525 [Acetobacter pomorum]KAA8452905.1 hypothetical protein FKW52_05750 [Acetobacter pomorum]KGB23516.1 hypothetical protein ApDm4_1910 [Acetobacter pomorum]
MNRATFTRRVALTSVCALAAEATVGFAALKLSATTDKDSALFALSDAFWRVHNEIWSADYLAEHEYGSPEQKRLEAKLEQLCQQEGLLVKQLAQVPARTQPGLKAKAAILQSLLPDIMRDCYLSDDSGEFLLVMSLLDDLTGGAQI